MRTGGRRRFQPTVSLALVTGAWGLCGLLLSGCSAPVGHSSAVTTGPTAPLSATKVDPSAGCSGASGQTFPTAQLPAATVIPFEAAGETGSYLTGGPAPGQPSVPLPLVFDLHGYLETASSHELVSGLGIYGSSHGFITVTPQVQFTVSHWNDVPGSADRAFLVALIDHIEATRCVDLRRVYMAGYSNGAFMTSSMVCELAGRLAAVATVSGIQVPANCHPTRPVPVIAFHGTADPLVPYNGGTTAEAKALPAPDGNGTFGSRNGTASLAGIAPLTAPIPTELAGWALRNHCAPHPTVSKAAAGVTLIAYGCPDGNTVELYRENGDGHTWPGSKVMALPSVRASLGPTTFAIDADQLMWAFFQAHPLPG